MSQKDYVILAIGIVSGAAAFFRYSEIGLMSALIVMFGVSYFLWRFTSPKKAVYTFGYMKNPPIAAFMTFLGCFLYLSFQGYSSANTWLYSLAVSILGGITAIVFNSVWNMG